MDTTRRALRGLGYTDATVLIIEWDAFYPRTPDA